MKIEVIGIGEDIQEHVKALKEALEGVANKQDDHAKAKAAVGDLVGDLLIERDLDPRAVMSAMLGMSAVIARCYCKPNDGVDPRKAFRKMAGRAWDIAQEIHDKVREDK